MTDEDAARQDARCEACPREPIPHIICRTSEALGNLSVRTDEDVPDGCSASLPDTRGVIEALTCLRQCMFPGRWLPEASDTCLPGDADGCLLPLFIQERLSSAYPRLVEAVRRAIPYRWKSKFAQDSGKGKPVEDVNAAAQQVLLDFFGALPAVRELLVDDVVAAYNGDPAAHSYAEVVMSYPCIAAITTHRIAHELYRLDVPIVPRIMSEVAHAETGIDIHPGAQIGRSFFIDHGTGVVIGETSRIGANVKIYQGVTLGAKSFPVDENGFPVKDIQRHPTIEDDVVIYAGATILGGDTVIGKGSVIGANVFVADSVPPGSTVTQKHPELRVR
ncbi:MAG: serine acetyltransferase [Acidobacteriota bacterium]|jgi:serine O-acetyltransferase|nr:serine acetyltransferase [Acidobacteriota bacterium]